MKIIGPPMVEKKDYLTYYQMYKIKSNVGFPTNRIKLHEKEKFL